jgi:hypothetical protein
MAEEREEEPKEEPKEEPQERRTEPQSTATGTKTDSGHAGERREEPQTEECPRCYVPVAAGKLGSHLYSAHGVERRQKVDDKSGSRTPKPKQKNEEKPKDDGNDDKDKKKGRWSEVRGGWG